MGSQGRTAKRIKKILWMFAKPEFASSHGIELPVKHRLISEGIAKQIFFGEYESKEIDIISRRLEPTDRVMEVGAGIGFLSAFCASKVGSENVFAYEANPELLEVIRTTYARNHLSPSISNVFLADEEGECDFYVHDEFWASSSVVSSNTSRKISVRKVKLNEEIHRVAPTFLIVDIEGGEKEFFGIIDLTGIRKVCVETHPGVLTDKDISDIFQILFQNGFVLDFSIIRKNVFYFYRES
jgi:FkbM family methyltransferase